MKTRPTIFLSGVSHEFGSFRDAVENEIQTKGCFPLNQPSFGVDYRTIEEMLRRKLSEADAVIHIVGFRFGAEPHGRPEGTARRSYTQMEFDIARELEKPVYVFLSADASVRDAARVDEQSENAEAVALQLKHRRTIENSDELFYPFKDKAELCRLVAAIPIVTSADFRVDVSRIDKYAPAELIGREQELALLNEAWLKVRRSESPRSHVITFVALGGEGKTSLVAKWAAELAHQGWPGCDAAFAWSFYSQGTREQFAASSDLFLKEALTFFGDEADKEFAASSAGAYEKGQRLARVIGQRRSLLILDGLEPLQYAPASPTPGELKDGGLAALLKGLAAHSEGLCIVTTRYSLPDLKAFWQTTAPEVKLLRLSREAGVDLLKTLGVHGTARELETLVEDVKGHALTLNLLGTYLRDAHGGDIRHRDLIRLEEADAEEQGGHAFRVIEAYERAFENEGDRGKRALAILKLFGLFDRPMTSDCLAALLEPPAIAGLSEPLVALNEAQRNVAFKRLEDAKLLTVNRDAAAFVSLDAHPLLREYFARQLHGRRAGAWRAAHKRLYEHLGTTTPDKDRPTLEDLQPLYQAVIHGCYAGFQQVAYDRIYSTRIRQGNEYYSTRRLGAFGSDLGAVTCFFDLPWRQPAPMLSEDSKALLLNQAAFYLHALGRAAEALEPMRLGLAADVQRQDWTNASRASSNLSELELTLGNVAKAIIDAELSVTYADRSGDLRERLTRRAVLADALHQAGRRTEAEICFGEAEQMQQQEPPHRFLYSRRGFLYCDLLLDAVTRAAWQRTFERDDSPQCSETANELYSRTLRALCHRATQTLRIAENTNLSFLSIALDNLTLGRVALYAIMLSVGDLAPENENPKTKTTLDNSVDGLRRAQVQTFIVNGLLSRAWMRCLTGERTGPESAQEDLDEAWEIAERGPMRLHMADIHLYRARLFFREKEYPWESPRADLGAARKLIEQCGYWRRKEELEDAEAVIL